MSILDKEQTDDLVFRMRQMYRIFKTKTWHDCDNYREGIIDFCDGVIAVSSQHVYEFATLRNELEEAFDEIDNEGESDD